MRVASISEKDDDASGAPRHLVLVHCSGRNVNGGGRNDLVESSFKLDLTFQAAQIGLVSQEEIEFIRVVKMGHLIVGNRLRQVFGFVDGDVDVGIRMRVFVNKDVPFDGQNNSFPQRPFLCRVSADDSRSRFGDVSCDIHLRPFYLPQTYPRSKQRPKSPGRAASRGRATPIPRHWPPPVAFLMSRGLGALLDRAQKGWNSSIGLPDGSSIRICLPPLPV